jgi:hypothetical protein
MAAGATGATIYAWFSRAGLASQLWFESPDAQLNTERYAALMSQREVIEDAYGGSLDFEDLPGKKSTRVGELLAGALVTDEQRWDEYLGWLLDRQTRLRNAIAAIGGVPTPASINGEPPLS